MEDWELDFEWGRLRRKIKERFGKKRLPDLNAILFLIGIQELGQIKESYSKEEKQDLMHIAVCRLLSRLGYYELEKIDDDGWPHWKLLRPIEEKGVKNQEKILKKQAIHYFRDEIKIYN